MTVRLIEQPRAMHRSSAHRHRWSRTVTHRRRLAGVLAVGVLLGLSSALATVPLQAQRAAAHAAVTSSTPADGEELSTAPTAVAVTFSEPTTLPGTSDEATVINADGKRVDTGNPRLSANRSRLIIGIKPGLPKGTYIASWSVISADTHPVGGSVQFGYGVPADTSASASATASTPDAGLSLLVGIAKGLLYLGLAIGLGVLPATLLLGASSPERRTAVRIARAGISVAVLACLLQLVLQYLWSTSGRPAESADAVRDAIGTFATSSYAGAVGIRAVALVIAAIAAGPFCAERRSRVWRVVFPGLAVVAVGSVVVNGHGGSGAWWQFVTTSLHAIGAVAWIGGLTVLGWLLLRGRMTAERLPRMRHWSLYAGVSVAVLAASGIIQALVEVRYPAALVTTQYGVILLIKIALVVVVLGFAVRGHRWIRSELRRSPGQDGTVRPAPGRTARLRKGVRWEAGVAVIVVVVSGVLSSITPAAADYSPTVTRTASIGPYQVRVEVSPARQGPETFKITVIEPSFNAALPDTLEVELNQVDGPVKNLPVQFPYRIAGVVHPGKPTPVTFSSAATTVPTSGGWTATITVVASKLQQYTNDVTYTVR